MGVEGIGNNILKLRRKKGVTQEVLAEFIGVTKTSVCKWETGATMPDIQMLPLLASYFEVSVDELIDYVPMLGREQIRFHYQRLAKAFGDRAFGEVLEECEGMIRKYYSCYPFLLQMVVLLLNHVEAADTEQNRNSAVKMALELCSHILADCQEVGICKSAVGLKGVLNLMQGRADLVIEEVGEEALRADYMENTGELLTMAYLMAGNLEKAEYAAQIGMYQSLMKLIDYAVLLLDISGKKAVSERKIAVEEEMACGHELLKRMDKILASFEMRKLNPNAAGKYEYQAAVYLAGRLAECRADKEAYREVYREAHRAAYRKTDRETGKGSGREAEAQPRTVTENRMEEEIFRHLEQYAAACRQLFADGIRLHGDSFFSSLDDWFEEMELGTTAVRSSGSVRESILMGFHNPVFSILKDQKRLRRLAEKCDADCNVTKQEEICWKSGI